jgi:hypothetical protein
MFLNFGRINVKSYQDFPPNEAVVCDDIDERHIVCIKPNNFHQASQSLLPS